MYNFGQYIAPRLYTPCVLWTNTYNAQRVPDGVVTCVYNSRFFYMNVQLVISLQVVLRIRNTTQKGIFVALSTGLYVCFISNSLVHRTYITSSIELPVHTSVAEHNRAVYVCIYFN